MHAHEFFGRLSESQREQLRRLLESLMGRPE
jgi:hypothetical protein